jgi:hypothetical protein
MKEKEMPTASQMSPGSIEGVDRFLRENEKHFEKRQLVEESFHNTRRDILGEELIDFLTGSLVIVLHSLPG